jgi:hypothetical protein
MLGDIERNAAIEAHLENCRANKSRRRLRAQQLSEQFERVIQRLQHAPHER